MRVLILDDSEITAQLLAGALASRGVAADTETTLEAMTERIDTGRYGLVLVDVNMPEMYGDDIVEFLKARETTPLKLVLYSDLPHAELAARAQSAGAHAYISKSLGLDGTADRIVQLLRDR